MHICEIARILYDRGHNAPGDGNITARLGSRYLLATPTGGHKGKLGPDDIVKATLVDGRSVDPDRRASSEIRLHLAIYRHRPDVHAIIHAHSPNTVGLTVAGVSLAEPVVPETALLLGSVPTVPYASPTTDAVPQAIAAFVDRCHAFVLERHGPVALGADLDEAFNRLEIVEHTAKITVAALAAGSAKPLAAAEVDKLRTMASEAGFLDGITPQGTPEDRLVDALAARVVARIQSS